MQSKELGANFSIGILSDAAYRKIKDDPDSAMSEKLGINIGGNPDNTIYTRVVSIRFVDQYSENDSLKENEHYCAGFFDDGYWPIIGLELDVSKGER